MISTIHIDGAIFRHFDIHTIIVESETQRVLEALIPNKGAALDGFKEPWEGAHRLILKMNKQNTKPVLSMDFPNYRQDKTTVLLVNSEYCDWKEN